MWRVEEEACGVRGMWVNNTRKRQAWVSEKNKEMVYIMLGL